MARFGWAGSAAALVLLLAGARPAEAYRCSRVLPSQGPSLYWPVPDRQIPWWSDRALSVDIPDHDATLAALKASFETWTAIDCSDIAFVWQGEGDNLRGGYTNNGANQNVVVFVNQGWSYDKATIAATTNAYDTTTGEIHDSDLELNDENFHFVLADLGCDMGRGDVDLQNTVTHEAGHILGLDHPPNTPEFEDTTMFASAPACETKKRTLADDDIAGICAIYPTGKPTVPCFTTSGPSFLEVSKSDGFGCGCRAAEGGEGAGRAHLPILLVALWAGVALRSRRRTTTRLRRSISA